MKKVFFGLLCFIGLYSCDQRPVFYVNGNWENGTGNRIYLNTETENGKLEALDSTVVEADFSFHLKSKFGEVRKMVVTFGKEKCEVMASEEPVEITIEEVSREKNGKSTTFLKTKCKGGREQQALEDGASLKTSLTFVQLGKMITASKVNYNNRHEVDSIANMLKQLDSGMVQSVKRYLDSTRNDIASVYFFENHLMDNNTYPEVLEYYNNLTDRVKQSALGKELKRKVDEMGSVSIGGTAPDFKAQTPEGKELSLYDLRGHVVLLDFWASWCGPCMAEMPNVKGIYKKYHDKGLEVLGVSLDSQKEPWVNAIQKHELNWHHVSTLNKFDCPIAKHFHVTGIPRMYILDKAGKIIAQDLRGEELSRKMDELFAQ